LHCANDDVRIHQRIFQREHVAIDRPDARALEQPGAAQVFDITKGRAVALVDSRALHLEDENIRANGEIFRRADRQFACAIINLSNGGILIDNAGERRLRSNEVTDEQQTAAVKYFFHK